MTQIQILGFLQLIFIGICIYYVDYREKKEMKRIEEVSLLIASCLEVTTGSQKNTDRLINLSNELVKRVTALEKKLK